MQNERQEINIDDFVDYEHEYRQYVKKAKKSGDQLVGLCPFHDDTTDSFSVNVKTGQWSCFADGLKGNFIDFYARIHNCDTKTAYQDILRQYHKDKPNESKKKKEKKGFPNSYTLEQYAEDKKLPIKWLADYCKCSTQSYNSGTKFLNIPYYYYDEEDNEVKDSGRERHRFANKEFRWNKTDAQIVLYGEWRLPEFRKIGMVILVEGESDTHSLWHIGLPALGVPGASLFNPRHVKDLKGLKVYIHQEPDKGGETFFEKVKSGLQTAMFSGEVYKFSCSAMDGCKDPSDLYMKFGKEEAAKKINSLLTSAKQVNFIPKVIEGAPIALRMPSGYRVDETGIWASDSNGVETMVCRTPILITKRLNRLDVGDEKIEISFYRDNEWHSGIYPRATIFTTRSITELADLGCMVTSENARLVVRYLSLLESENVCLIPKIEATSTLGWQPNGKFIPGHAGDMIIDVEQSQRAKVAAYHQQGTLEEWVNIMRPHRERLKFRLILAASFAAPLLKKINQRIPILYMWGDARTGKTAAARAGGSVWSDTSKTMMNFNATHVGLERAAAYFSDLPLVVDERQLAGSKQESIETTVYMLAEGVGKTRGSRNGGIQAMHEWRTVVIATGEEPLSGDASMTGVNTRVIEIYQGPFDNEYQAAKMYQDIHDCYGSAGPEFIRHLVQLKDEDIQNQFNEMLEYVKSISDGKASSHIASIAAFALADSYADEWIFGGNKETAWEKAKEMARWAIQEQMSASEADVNERAVQFVADWVSSNQSFFGEHAIGQCYGYITADKKKAFVFPSIFDAALKKEGYNPRKTKKHMVKNGLLGTTERTDRKGVTYQVSKPYNGKQQRFVELFLDKMSPNDEADDSKKDIQNTKHETRQQTPEPREDQTEIGTDWAKADDKENPFLDGKTEDDDYEDIFNTPDINKEIEKKLRELKEHK